VCVPRDADSHSDIGCNGETGRDSGDGLQRNTGGRAPTDVDERVTTVSGTRRPTNCELRSEKLSGGRAEQF
jgi:hypothetical protein